MEKKFKALRFVGSCYKILGIIGGVITAITSIGFCVFSILGGSILGSIMNGLGNSSSSSGAGPAGLFSGVFAGVVMGVIILIYGGLGAITLYALGESIYLALAVEENTRTTALLLTPHNNP